jgi:hypothetical protein
MRYFLILSCLIFTSSVERNSKFGSGAIWASNFSTAFRESRFDAFFLILLEGAL